VLSYQPYGQVGLLISDIDLSEATRLLATRYKPFGLVICRVWNRCNMPTGMPHRRGSKIDPILQAMLASIYGVFPASLLSLRPASRRVSRDILRY
jgi:hypothetical protein